MKRFFSTINVRFLNRAQIPTTATLPFQVLSDLHLEVGQQYSVFDFPTTAPNLILAGDIGLLSHYDAYLDFLQKQTARYDRVILVLGNHEFYGLDFATALSTAKKLEKEPRLEGKLYLLQQTRIDLPGAITILGCTLWSHVPDEAKGIVSQKVNDFRKIKNWTVDQHNDAHKSDLTWLKAELDNVDPGRSVLVVTHHAPLVQRTSRPEHIRNPWTSAFATDVVSGDKTWGLIKYWVYGHTHYTTEFEKHGIRVVSNQRGYVVPGSLGRKGVDEGFDMSKTIQVPVGQSEKID
ncbi:phosphoesterase [Hypomontagnella monticulosa]|nr:phosphoesterase [Hypomontagnella monticulosa]